MPLPTSAVYVAPSWILRQLLVDLGLGVLADGSTTAWQVSTVAEPSTPDQAITVYDTSSIDHGRLMIDGSRVEDRGCQIRIRSAKYNGDGYDKARDIAMALDQQVRRQVVTVNSIAYMIHAVNRKSDVIALGEDTPTSRRKVFTLNVTITVNLASLNY